MAVKKNIGMSVIPLTKITVSEGREKIFRMFVGRSIVIQFVNTKIK